MKAIQTLLSFFLFVTIILPSSHEVENTKTIARKWAEAHNLNPTIRNVICKELDNTPLLYVVNFVEGWVMISADESLLPILGFSFSSQYEAEKEPEALKSLFKFYNFVKDENRRNNVTYSEEWESLKSSKLRNTSDVESVDPLLPATWHQIWPYNAYVPLDDDPDLPASCNGHHNTSCGPTAFAQVLHYWEYPVHGTGYHSYNYEGLGFVEADFENTFYNWSNMPNYLNSDDPESVYTDIATLMLHAAVAVDDSYSSGGGLDQYSYAAVNYFGYSPTCEVFYRDDFTNEEWHNIYRNDLDNGRPIMMEGCSEGSAEPWENGVHFGHYFVCDGYYGDDYYHINWGWGPGSGGYYPLFALGDFIYQNKALIGMEPNYENNKLILNDPYVADDNTIVLLHFDGDFTNQSTLTDDPISYGTTSFIDNSSMGLGQCLHLDNNNQANQSYLNIADDNDLDLTGDWTIEMWFKPLSFGDQWYKRATLINKIGDTESYEANYLAYIRPPADWSSNSLYCDYMPIQQVDRNPATISTDIDFIELNKWYHFSFIRNTADKTLKLVIHNENKELIHYHSSPYCNEVASQPQTSSRPLYIGTSFLSNTFFDGYIDELRISNVVRDFETTSTQLALTSPAGGEAWQASSNHLITWSCTNIANLKLEYSSDNGVTWNVIANPVDAALGQYDWTLPNEVSENYLVRITDTANDNTLQVCGSTFEVYGDLVLNLLSPIGNETFQCESTIPIIWERNGVNTVTISYSTNGGTSWTEIVSGHPASDIPYYWDIPNVASANYKIKIEGNSISNESAATFEVKNEEVPGGPFAVNDDTALLLSFDNNLNNKSAQASDATSNGDIQFYTNFLEWLGYCARLDGGSSINVQHGESLNLTGGWTIELWFYLNSLNAELVNKPTANWESNYNIHVEAPDGHMEARFYDTGGNRYQISTPAGTIETGKWYHVCFTNDDSNNQIALVIKDEYQTIVYQNTLSYPAGTVPATSSNDLDIGVNVNGYIDELRILNFAQTVDVQDDNAFGKITNYQLSQNYPNPFNPTTLINYSLPKESFVEITVFDLLGQTITKLVSELKNTGYHQVQFDAHNLNSGIYFYTITAGEFMESKKMMLVK